MTAVHLSPRRHQNPPLGASERQLDSWTVGQQGFQFPGKQKPPPPSTPYYHHHKGGGGSLRLVTYFYLSSLSKCPKGCSDAPIGDSAGQPSGQPGQRPGATTLSLGQQHPGSRPRRPGSPHARVTGPNGRRPSCNHRPRRARPLLRLTTLVAMGPRSWNVVALSAPACIPAALLVPAPQAQSLQDADDANLHRLCGLGGDGWSVGDGEGVGEKTSGFCTDHLLHVHNFFHGGRREECTNP